MHPWVTGFMTQGSVLQDGADQPAAAGAHCCQGLLPALHATRQSCARPAGAPSAPPRCAGRAGQLHVLPHHIHRPHLASRSGAGKPDREAVGHTGWVGGLGEGGWGQSGVACVVHMPLFWVLWLRAARVTV